jgi:hypothetical protein
LNRIIYVPDLSNNQTLFPNENSLTPPLFIEVTIYTEPVECWGCFLCIYDFTIEFLNCSEGAIIFGVHDSNVIWQSMHVGILPKPKITDRIDVEGRCLPNI